MKPKYQQVADWAKEQLMSGAFSLGDKFYSENYLCRQCQVSRQTVRQALEMLEQQGLIERQRGSGTYIKELSPVKNAGYTVGVVSTYFSSYIFPSIITGIESTLSKGGHSMLLATTNNQVEEEAAALQRMLEQRVHALIVEPTKSALPNPNTALYQAMADRGIPVVFINAAYPWSSFPSVHMDDAAAGYLATSHLVSKGHTQIAGIFKGDDMQGHLRYKGYLNALNAFNIPLVSQRIMWYTTEDKGDMLFGGSYLAERLKGCTAVVCYNDEIAVRLMQHYTAKGAKLPRELSVVGVDNSDASAICQPPLTTVNHPKEQLGQWAASALLAYLEDRRPIGGKTFQPALVERLSVTKR